MSQPVSSSSDNSSKALVAGAAVGVFAGKKAYKTTTEMAKHYILDKGDDFVNSSGMNKKYAQYLEESFTKAKGKLGGAYKGAKNVLDTLLKNTENFKRTYNASDAEKSAKVFFSSGINDANKYLNIAKLKIAKRANIGLAVGIGVLAASYGALLASKFFNWINPPQKAENNQTENNQTQGSQV